jgi:hypothetical protein
MNDDIIRKHARMKRVKQHIQTNPINPPNLAVTAEATGLNTVITELEAAGVAQDGGFGAVSGAVDSRLAAIKDLRLLMSSLAKAARSLDKATYPDVAAKMRMGGINSFAQLETRALLFKETLAPIKQVFIDRGAPADVEEEIDGYIATMRGAGDSKLVGLDTQVGGTLSLEALARRGTRHIQQLDAMLTQIYRKDPVMLGLWRIAQRATPYSTSSAPTPTPPPSEGGGGTQPVGS